MSGINLLISDRWGVYIPQQFATGFLGWDGVSEDDRAIIEAGPEHEHYWDAWSDITSTAFYTDENGNVWRLWQDGDLFCYCEDLMDDDEYYSFFGERRERSHQFDFDADSRYETDNWYDTSAELH